MCYDIVGLYYEYTVTLFAALGPDAVLVCSFVMLAISK